MANIGTLTAHIGMDTARLRADTLRAQGMFQGFSANATRGLGAITASAAKLGGALAAMGVTIGAAAIFKSITRAGVDFEQTMRTVAGVMRATTEEMEGLTTVARRMGETTEWTASESGDALLFLGMAGFKATQAIEALPGVLDLATAGNLGLGRSADVASNALTAMGLPVKELSRVNDVFIGTITRSNTNMEMMAESFKYAAPVARAYGYSIEELSGLIGALGNAGIQGSMAGTQLAMAIQKSDEVARKHNLTSRDFIDVLEGLRAKGMDATQVIAEFGIRAGRAAGVIFEATDQVKDFQETLGGVSGEAAKLAETMRSTVGGAFKELRSVIESLALDVFETYRDDLKRMVEGTTRWIRENKNEIVKLATKIEDTLGGIIDFFGSVGRALDQAQEGFDDFFTHVETRAASTADSVARSGEEIREALAPPETALWEDFWAWLDDVAMKISYVFDYLNRIAANTAAAIVGHFRVAFREFSQAVTDMANIVKTAFAGDILRALDMLDEMNARILKNMGQNWQALLDSYQSSWNNMIKNLKGPDWMERLGAMPAPEQMPEFVGPQQFVGPLEEVEKQAVHTNKAVSQLTEGMEGLGDATEKTAGAFATLVDTEVTLYGDLLLQEGKTREELLGLWEGYAAARLQQIDLEAEGLLKMGVSHQLVADTVRAETEALDKERDAILGVAEAQDLLNEQASLYERILQSEAVSREARQAIWEDYKNARLEQIAEEAAALAEMGVSADLIAMTSAAQRAELLEQEKELYGQHSEFMRNIYQGIGDFAGNAFRGMFSEGQSFFGALEKAGQSFKGFFVNLLADMLARFIATSVAELAAHIGLEKAKTAVTAEEAAKRAALSGAGTLGILGVAFGVATSFLSKGGIVGMQAGGPVWGGHWGLDSILAMLTPGEFVMPEPAVRQIGIPALEYMKREKEVPGDRGEQTTINVDMGGFTFTGMERRDVLLVPYEVEDAVVRAVKSAVRKGKLER